LPHGKTRMDPTILPPPGTRPPSTATYLLEFLKTLSASSKHFLVSHLSLDSFFHFHLRRYTSPDVMRNLHWGLWLLTSCRNDDQDFRVQTLKAQYDVIWITGVSLTLKTDPKSSSSYKTDTSGNSCIRDAMTAMSDSPFLISSKEGATLHQARFSVLHIPTTTGGGGMFFTFVRSLGCGSRQPA